MNKEKPIHFTRVHAQVCYRVLMQVHRLQLSEKLSLTKTTPTIN